MVALCFYFQVHQPYRLRQVRLDENTPAEQLFSDEKNRSVFHKVAEKCYWPMGKLLEHLLLKYPNDFRVSFSFSGTFLSQCKEYDPHLYALYTFLGQLPNAHIICETSHHSLAALRSADEFRSQVAEQLCTLKNLFNKTPRVFRNTELIYSDAIGSLVSQLGFEGCLLEGWDPWLPQGWNAHHVFRHPTQSSLKLLPKSYKLSDDMAFRFSDRNWASWPLTADRYVNWLESLLDGQHEFIGLFMDYETFGEHQWADSGIFHFFEDLIHRVVSHPQLHFVGVEEALQRDSRSAMAVPVPTSWADTERDLSAWLSNPLQEEALDRVMALEPMVRAIANPELTEQWRKLQTSDHFYYMCIKYSHDGDVHKYFSPYDSPYDAYLDHRSAVEAFERVCRVQRALQLNTPASLGAESDSSINIAPSAKYDRVVTLS
ncbi:MAG: alpha-amylase [Betaproteobacteria bacterium]|nr:alpha-amylase [Betaproteobacteria bacterium]